ncbi:hypothetical protein, partial [Lysinibacillus sp. GbtcB16]|uniref:hypothetical protein n=1 Tax=Lysinibacillus sp. GbtcB16 TaxID=2824761 RepID=UPI001C2FFCF2
MLAQIRQISERITDCIRTYLKLDARIGFGGVKASWTNISDSTEEAFHGLLQQSIVHEQGGQV